MSFSRKPLSLHRVFHSIRFKVNKVGIQWYPFFYVYTLSVRLESLVARCGRGVYIKFRPLLFFGRNERGRNA
ncbi:hypothetical protein EVA_09447 [gut metagenome]|uniref:Uncharacterized protein n=1 Tax=gut metagenome TaxID=749906 RepID=J9CQM6_9ZZZZ